MFEKGGPTLVELARQALSSTDQGYVLLAPKFDKTPFRTPDALLAAVVEQLEPVDRALDLCCGTGAATAAIRPRCRVEVVGLDRVQAMLDVAAENVPQQAGDTPVRFVQGDALTWDGGEAFDLVVSFGAFGHILPKDEAAFIDTVYKALKPGGRFVFVTGRNPGPTHPAWWMAQGFNFAMHVRNAVIDPPFVMFYLTFLWPDVGAQLEDRGFEVTAREGVLAAPFKRAILVEARKPAPESAGPPATS